MTCKHGAEWYNCQKCHLNSQYKATAREAEKALTQMTLLFAVIAILGYIIPKPFSAFTFFGAAVAVIIAGLFSKKETNN